MDEGLPLLVRALSTEAGSEPARGLRYFPVVSNGELVVSMIRWLAGDTDTPTIQPQRFTLPAILLTHRQMQAVFLLVEVLLPLTVMRVGVAVWSRRR